MILTSHRDRLRLTFTLTIAAIGLASGARSASAQTSASPDPRFYYGVTAGPEHRTVKDTFLPRELPAGASSPTFDGTATTLSVEGGVAATRRMAVMAFWDQTFGSSSGPGKWGTTVLHGIGRAWISRRVWIEAGGGLSGLAYRAPQQSNRTVTQFWAPGVSAGAGLDLLRGPHVSLVVLGRYSRATFNGLTIQRMSVQVGLLGRQ